MKKIDVIIPCLNEEKILNVSINTLRDFLKKNMKGYKYNITIADNGSKDQTFEIAKQLSKQHKEVRAIHLTKRGRGRALKKAWTMSDADILSYMDVDLSTDLKSFPAMINAVANTHHIGIGTRLTRNSETKRAFKRDFISKTYNILVKLIVNTKFSDAQCGFKAINKQTFMELLPHLKDNEWFLDTEMLTIAEKKGYKIHEEPVLWIEDLDSRVKIIDTALKYIRDLIKLRFRLMRIK
jgi:glycosyltransferase involved in cell wall biosynthesis